MLAQDEARTLKHNYIGTEHILLGLLREEEGLAARVLDTLDITVEEVRGQVARIVGQGDTVATGQIPFTPRVKKVFELAFREALSLGQKQVGTEHILLGLVRENEGVAARILRDFDAEAETIRDEMLRMLSGPSRRHRAPTGTRRFTISAERGGTRSVVTQRFDETHRLIVACPGCAIPIEAVATDHRNAHLQVSMQGTHGCPGCGKRWAITVSAAWTDPAPPADPEDDIGSEMTVWSHSQPAHVTMSCFRCDQALERVTLDRAAPSLAHVQYEGDRTCPSCGKQWRIAYDVSWEELPGGPFRR